MRIHNGDIYELKVRHGILKKYLDEFKTTAEEAGISKLRAIFLAALRDFFSEKISTDELNYVTNRIYFEFKNPSWFDNYDTEFATILSTVSDISYIAWKGEKRELARIIDRLKEYYEENKHLIGEK